MSTINKEVLGFDVPVVGVADSLTQLAEFAGNEQRALDFANNYVIFHKHLGTLRDAIVAFFVKETGVKMLTKKEGDKEVIDETPAEYIERLEEEMGGEGSLAKFQDQINSLCAAIAVDYKVTVRGTGASSKPAQKYLTMASAIKDAGKLDAFIAKFGLDVPADTDDTTTLYMVANKIKSVMIEQQKAAAAALVS